MSYFDSASLVMIPSGYKDQKVYSVKPIDGSGDLAFTRSNDTATRVASNGLIEKVRTNLQTYSQDFSNAVWVKSAGATLTHSQTDPNGGTTASRLQMPSGTSNYFAASAISGLTNGGQYTHSVYMKSNTGSTQSVRILDGVRGAAGGTLLASVTTSWQRFEVVITTASTSAGLQIDNVAGTYNNDIIIAFAQTEVSDFGATPYIATTSAAVSVGPVANLPRLDYSGGATCPKLLLEGQRTNLYNYSEQLNQWLTSSATVTANYAVSPDGYTNADRVQFAAGGLVYVSGTGSAGENTLSVYAKATNGVSAKFSFFANGAVTYSSDQTATGEWQRFTFTYTYSAVTAGLSVATTGADDVIFYGFQHEIGAYETSYIPTLGAAVTRGSDISLTASVPSLIGQTEGTMFVEMERKNMTQSMFVILSLLTGTTAGSYGNSIYFFQNGTSNFVSDCFVSNSAQFNFTKTGGLSIGTHKIALAYKANDFALYIDGVQIGTDNSGSVPAMNFLTIGGGADALGHMQSISQALLFKTRLSNSDLAALTA
jgi:hypothetical protein